MAEAFHIQVSQYIRSRIESGEYPVGSRIPTENELATLFGISRPTVRQALDGLAKEGYLTRIKGSGTFVTQPKVVHESTSFITGYQAESLKNNRILQTNVLSLSVIPAEEHVAQALEISTNEKVICLTRVRYLKHYNNDAPVLYTTVYVPHKLFPDMCHIDFTNISFYDVLTEHNLEVKHAYKKLEVMLPSIEVSTALKISSFEPVVFITSQGKTASMTPIEYAESYYPASHSSFLIEIHS